MAFVAHRGLIIQEPFSIDRTVQYFPKFNSAFEYLDKNELVLKNRNAKNAFVHLGRTSYTRDGILQWTEILVWFSAGFPLLTRDYEIQPFGVRDTKIGSF